MKRRTRTVSVDSSGLREVTEGRGLWREMTKGGTAPALSCTSSAPCRQALSINPMHVSGYRSWLPCHPSRLPEMSDRSSNSGALTNASVHKTDQTGTVRSTCARLAAKTVLCIQQKPRENQGSGANREGRRHAHVVKFRNRSERLRSPIDFH